MDIACGSGQSISGLKRIARQIIDLDIGPRLLDDARKRHPEVRFVQGSGEEPGLDVTPEFEATLEFEWLCRQAGRFGFVLSYPRDNAYGIAYEPWHWCFVGQLARR